MLRGPLLGTLMGPPVDVTRAGDTGIEWLPRNRPVGPDRHRTARLRNSVGPLQGYGLQASGFGRSSALTTHPVRANSSARASVFSPDPLAPRILPSAFLLTSAC